jgi:hypothetical protein
MGILVTNEGLGIAKDVYMDVKVWERPGPKCALSFEVLDKENWTGTFAFERFFNMISNSNYRMPPGHYAQPLMLRAIFKPPFQKELRIQRREGCEGGPPSESVFVNDGLSLARVYDDFIRKHGNDELSDDDWERVAGNLFGYEFGEGKTSDQVD